VPSPPRKRGTGKEVTLYYQSMLLCPFLLCLTNRRRAPPHQEFRESEVISQTAPNAGPDCFHDIDHSSARRAFH
jgi:hypothetical protein